MITIHHNFDPDHFDADMAARYNKYLAARRFLLDD